MERHVASPCSPLDHSPGGNQLTLRAPVEEASPVPHSEKLRPPANSQKQFTQPQLRVQMITA